MQPCATFGRIFNSASASSAMPSTRCWSVPNRAASEWPTKKGAGELPCVSCASTPGKPMPTEQMMMERSQTLMEPGSASVRSARPLSRRMVVATTCTALVVAVTSIGPRASQQEIPTQLLRKRPSETSMPTTSGETRRLLLSNSSPTCTTLAMLRPMPRPMMPRTRQLMPRPRGPRPRGPSRGPGPGPPRRPGREQLPRQGRLSDSRVLAILALYCSSVDRVFFLSVCCAHKKSSLRPQIQKISSTTSATSWAQTHRASNTSWEMWRRLPAASCSMLRRCGRLKRPMRRLSRPIEGLSKRRPSKPRESIKLLTRQGHRSHILFVPPAFQRSVASCHQASGNGTAPFGAGFAPTQASSGGTGQPECAVM